jgi:NitT/TauT family transport system substrate-binding protein
MQKTDLDKTNSAMTLSRRQLMAGVAGAGTMLMVRPANAADAVTLRLNWILSGVFSVFWYGKERGFFRDEGIDLTPAEGQGSARTVQSVAAGGDMFGLADGGSIILGATKGAGVKAVMGILNKSPYTISMREETGVKTVKDLVGKTIAVTPGEASLPLLQAVWNANGIDPQSVHLLNVDGAAKLTAVLEKRVDGLLAGFESQAVILDHKGLKQIILEYADLNVNTQGVSLFTTGELIRKNPDLVRRMVRATVRSFREGLLHPEDVVDAGMRVKADEDRSIFVDQWKAAATLFYSPIDTKRRLGYMMPEDWSRTLELMKRYQELVTDKPPTDFYTDEFVPEA